MTPKKREFTYETGVDEAIHPVPEIASGMTELAVSQTCKYGCKLYQHPASEQIVVLAHSSSYGCKRKRTDILDEAVRV